MELKVMIDEDKMLVVSILKVEPTRMEPELLINTRLNKTGGIVRGKTGNAYWMNPETGKSVTEADEIRALTPTVEQYLRTYKTLRPEKTLWKST